MNPVNPSELQLSDLRALWGIVTPNVRKISISQIENTVLLSFYYDEESTETEIELSEDAASEVIADFP